MITIQILIFFFVFILVYQSIKILKPHERGVVFRLGRVLTTVGPGLVFVVPFIDRMVRVGIGEQDLSFDLLSVTDKFGKAGSINVKISYRLDDPQKAVIEIYDFPEKFNSIARDMTKDFIRARAFIGLGMELAKIEDLITKKLTSISSKGGIIIKQVKLSVLET